MARRYRTRSGPTPETSDIDGALAAMDADELRDLVRDMLLELEERPHERVVNDLIDRAARNEAGWIPDVPSDETVAEIISFAKAAVRTGQADPHDVDDYLRQGSNAFLGKDYQSTIEIFRALLPPIGSADIYLGQHELVDEVLGADVSTCAAQYVVSIYMTSQPDHRAKAVRAAIDEMRGIGHLWEPLRELEQVAVEPLPELDDFLPRWRAIIEENISDERGNDWDTDSDRWLREVVRRLEGGAGLARVARSTKRADDLRAWCRSLAEAGDWKAALPAYEEAADIVSDKMFCRGDFLDGAALAAQELDREDLPDRLERAWREVPSLLRLRRWLGSARSKPAVRSRAAQALESCPGQAHRQRSVLHLILGDHQTAAELLAAAPGLGWSRSEHPGHLSFPVFGRLLAGTDPDRLADIDLSPAHGMDYDEFDAMTSRRDEPRLALPGLAEILSLAGAEGPADDKARRAVIEAMRTAAAKRVAGVTEHKRRRYYGHAAELVAACAAADAGPETTRWVAELRVEYRRYPALRREFDRHVGCR